MAVRAADAAMSTREERNAFRRREADDAIRVLAAAAAAAAAGSSAGGSGGLVIGLPVVSVDVLPVTCQIFYC